MKVLLTLAVSAALTLSVGGAALAKDVASEEEHWTQIIEKLQASFDEKEAAFEDKLDTVENESARAAFERKLDREHGLEKVIARFEARLEALGENDDATEEEDEDDGPGNRPAGKGDRGKP